MQSEIEFLLFYDKVDNSKMKHSSNVHSIFLSINMISLLNSLEIGTFHVQRH